MKVQTKFIVNSTIGKTTEKHFEEITEGFLLRISLIYTVKKLLRILVLLLSTVFLSKCSSTKKFIEKGYSYNFINGPAALDKVWMPKYVKYNKKQKRLRFIDGHYRIVVRGQAWTYRQARLRNRYRNI
jgi:hypothetical protein